MPNEPKMKWSPYLASVLSYRLKVIVGKDSLKCSKYYQKEVNWVLLFNTVDYNMY